MENFLRSKEFLGLIENGILEETQGVVQAGDSRTFSTVVAKRTQLIEAQRKQIDDQRKRIEEQKLNDLKVKNYIFQAIDRTVLDTILKKDTNKDIWNAMKKKFEGNERVKRSHLQALRKEFETLKMRTSEGVT